MLERVSTEYEFEVESRDGGDRSEKQPYLPLPPLPTFDLAPIVLRVKREHPDWTEERLEKAEHSYRVFCAIAKAKPNEKTPILSLDMDEVWHAHILFTRRYEQDCREYLGFFMHHEPTAVGVPFDNADPCSRDGPRPHEPHPSFRWC